MSSYSSQSQQSGVKTPNSCLQIRADSGYRISQAGKWSTGPDNYELIGNITTDEVYRNNRAGFQLYCVFESQEQTRRPEQLVITQMPFPIALPETHTQ